MMIEMITVMEQQPVQAAHDKHQGECVGPGFAEVLTKLSAACPETEDGCGEVLAASQDEDDQPAAALHVGVAAWAGEVVTAEVDTDMERSDGARGVAGAARDDVPRAAVLLVQGTPVSARDLGAYLQELRDGGRIPTDLTIRPQLMGRGSPDEPVMIEEPEELTGPVQAGQSESGAESGELAEQVGFAQSPEKFVGPISEDDTADRTVLGGNHSPHSDTEIREQTVVPTQVTSGQVPEQTEHSPEGRTEATAKVTTAYPPDLTAAQQVNTHAEDDTPDDVKTVIEQPGSREIAVSAEDDRDQVVRPVLPGDELAVTREQHGQEPSSGNMPMREVVTAVDYSSDAASAAVTTAVSSTGRDDVLAVEPAAPEVRMSIEHSAVSGELVRMARMAHRSDERAEVQLRLDPPELGSVTMRISSDKGRLTAELTVTTPEAMAALRDGLPRLRADLVAAGYEVDDLQVTIDAREGGDRGQEMGREQYGQGKQEHPVNEQRSRQEVYQRLRALQPESSFEYVA